MYDYSINLLPQLKKKNPIKKNYNYLSMNIL